MSEWISVNNQFKPEDGSTVLVSWDIYGKHGGYVVAHVWQGSFMDGHGHYVHNPRYWMEITPPEGV